MAGTAIIKPKAVVINASEIPAASKSVLVLPLKALFFVYEVSAVLCFLIIFFFVNCYFKRFHLCFLQMFTVLIGFFLFSYCKILCKTCISANSFSSLLADMF